jgi:hypothetical protein
MKRIKDYFGTKAAPADPDAEINKYYRTLFLTGNVGRGVLKHMLHELGFLAHEIKPEHLVMRNYAGRLLQRLGCTDDSLVDEFLEALKKKVPIEVENE